MGRGDKRSKKGKIALGSFGKSRPHKKKSAAKTDKKG
jgi:30S ribosomal protein S31